MPAWPQNPCPPAPERASQIPLLTLLSCGNFDEFNQDFAALAGRHQKEIDAGAVGAGVRFRINRLERKAGAQKLGRARNVAHLAFHLLDSLAKPGQEARQGAIACGVSRGQDIEAHAMCEFELELESILAGRRLGKARLSAALANLLELDGLDRDADGQQGPSAPNQRPKFRIGKPVPQDRFGCGAALAKKLAGSLFAFARTGANKPRDP
jgi:hypothetical protein